MVPYEHALPQPYQVPVANFLAERKRLAAELRQQGDETGGANRAAPSDAEVPRLTDARELAHGGSILAIVLKGGTSRRVRSIGRQSYCSAAAIALVIFTAVSAHGYAGRAPIGKTVAVNTHYGAPRAPVDGAALAQLAAAGVHWIRNDLDWAAIEQTPGVYDFATPGYDALVAGAEREGLRVLFILDYGNPLYGPAQAVVSDAGRQAFAAYAAAAAARYGGLGHAWEIWNEPNLPQFWSGGGARPDPIAYAQLVAVAAPAVHEADPSGQVLASGAFMALPQLVRAIGGVPGLEFLAGLFTAGMLAHVDGITAHFYRAEPPETVAADVMAIRALMAAAGRTLPVWSGEWGYSTYDKDAPSTGINYLPAVSVERQAAYAARMLLFNHALGLAGSVYFKDRDAAAPQPGNIEHHFGLMHDDLSPKPAYAAVAALTRLLGEARFRGRLPLGEGNHGLAFRRRKENILALWSEWPTTWRLRARSAEARVLARDGRDITPPDLRRRTAFVTIDPDDGPIYLLGPIAVRATATVGGTTQ